MRLLTTPTTITQQFRRLINRYNQLDWAVAWASHAFPPFELLKEHRVKIRHVVVGTHFHQTHPEFIEEFMNCPQVRFRLDREGLNGVFHPKVYLFSDNEDSWEAVIGSPNFTQAAFARNVECAILITPDDANGASIFQTLLTQIREMWEQARNVTHAELQSYTFRWLQNRQRRIALAGNDVPRARAAGIYDLALLNMTWQQYVQGIRANGNFLPDRLQMLAEARQLFNQHASLSAIAEQHTRARLAGTATADADFIWRLFGTLPNTNYKNRITANNPGLSAALDLIPLEGPVTKADFEAWLDKLRTIFIHKGPFQGIAVATRLPCIKRPDYFICLNGENWPRLHVALGLQPAKLSPDDYWDAVIQPILDSPWWQEPRPAAPDEANLWDNRLALLDALYYQGQPGGNPAPQAQ